MAPTEGRLPDLNGGGAAAAASITDQQSKPGLDWVVFYVPTNTV